MIKKINFLLAIGFSLMTFGFVTAQNNPGKTNQSNRISLKPIVADQAEDLPGSASSLLENKMQQIATFNGLGASSTSPRFIITVNLSVISKDIIPGPPTLIAMNIDATFYIADYRTQTVFSTKTISLKAVGDNPNKAYIDGIKNINANSDEFKSFVEEGKNKIIAYFNDKCDFIIQDAKALVSQKKYQEAIFQLTSVPDVCEDCYKKTSSALGPIFKIYMNDLSIRNLASARAIWAANPNSSGANEVSGLLSQILPDAACYNDCQILVKSIQKKVLSDENKNWDFQMKQYNNNVSMENQRLNAYREIGIAYAANQPKTVYRLAGWLW